MRYGTMANDVHILSSPFRLCKGDRVSAEPASNQPGGLGWFVRPLSDPGPEWRNEARVLVKPHDVILDPIP